MFYFKMKLIIFPTWYQWICCHMHGSYILNELLYTYISHTYISHVVFLIWRYYSINALFITQQTIYIIVFPN